MSTLCMEMSTTTLTGTMEYRNKISVPTSRAVVTDENVDYGGNIGNQGEYEERVKDNNSDYSSD